MENINQQIITEDNGSVVYTSLVEEEIKPYELKASQKIYRGFKRIMDFLIAFLALIILIPVFLITAIMIRIDSRGHIFFKQKRVGKNDKDFICIKFRSMSKDARHNVASYEYDGVQSDITKVGRFIRKTSIDELPQLYCLLTGKMSLIGYRPTLREEQLLHIERKKSNVYQVRPGITGWAQVNGRDVLAANPKLKAQYDAYYVEHFSLWLDIKIFFMTIKKVLSRSDIEEGVVNNNEIKNTSKLIKRNIKLKRKRSKN